MVVFGVTDQFFNIGFNACKTKAQVSSFNDTESISFFFFYIRHLAESSLGEVINNLFTTVHGPM